VTGGVVLTSTNPLKGLYSASLPNVSSAYLREDFPAATDVYVSLYLKVNALPSSDVRFVMFSDQGTTVGNIVLRSNGVLRLRNGATQIGADSAPLSTGTLYRIGLHQKAGTGSDAVLEGYVAVGDAAFGAPFASTTSGTWTTQADRLQFGTTTGVALDGVFDNVRLDVGNMPPAGAAPGGLVLARAPYAPRVVGDAPSALVRPLLSGPTGNETWKVYYYAGAQMIAMRVLTGTTGNSLYYLHSDHLGSTSVTTDASGAVVARQWYYPYGTVRASSGALPTD
jgi:hypothetical protein